MPRIEAVRSMASLLGISRSNRAIGLSPEGSTQSPFSPDFLGNQAAQRDLDNRFASVTPLRPPTPLSYGDDHIVSLMGARDGTQYVVKILKPESREHLAFGLGIPAREIPFGPNQRAVRQQLAAQRGSVEVDQAAVVEKLRLMHVMALTYLDGGTGAIWPTAIVEGEGGVQRIQRYIPQPPTSLVSHPREVQIESQAKAALFLGLQDRWQRMLTTPDFSLLPHDVQEYMRFNPPDSAQGANAHFFGLNDVVAIDY